MEIYHKPVMLDECIEALNIKPDGIYVDVTFGGGGHSRAILNKLGDKGKLIAFDQDIDAEANIIEDERFIFIRQNFQHLNRFLKYYGFIKVDGILADLGVSSHQFDEGSRGFSIRFDSELDMRMNQTTEITASKILNEYADERLLKIMSEYGEVHNAKTLVRKISEQRVVTPFLSTQDLIARMKSVVTGGNPNVYFAKIFQALRIEVNGEMDALEKMLSQCYEALNTGGRLVVLSYHSLEDRLVKNFIKTNNASGEVEKDMFGRSTIYYKAINKKVIVATEEEQKINPRSRSAKLRIAERIN